MRIKIFQVDAFTATPFKGNPAAVCLLPEPKDEIWMQKVANEQNLSETAFLYKEENGFVLRWFTPTIEVDLCGHATLASAHILWQTNILQPNEQARFQTKSGLLTAEYNGNIIELIFPALIDIPAKTPEKLVEALGVSPTYVGKFGKKYLIEVENEEIVKNLKPDFQALKLLPERGVTVTSLSSSSEYDFVSRYFAPWVGIDEDPANGSSHCCLGPYWSRLFYKTELKAHQASKRGGDIFICLQKDRVKIGGNAVTVMAGELFV